MPRLIATRSLPVGARSFTTSDGILLTIVPRCVALSEVCALAVADVAAIIIVAAPVRPENAGLANLPIAEIVHGGNRDPLAVFLDLGLEEDLDTGFIGGFMNAVEGVEPQKHNAGVSALSDAGAHLVYLCDAGFGLDFLAHWVREGSAFDIVEGIRRVTRRQAGLYGMTDRGRSAVGAHADLLLFDPASVAVSPARRVNDLPGGGPRTIRDPAGVHGVFVNGTGVFDGMDYVAHAKGPGCLLDPSCRRGRQGLQSAQ